MTLHRDGDAVHDPYRAVSLVILAAAIVGMLAAVVGAIKVASPAMFASAITLGLASAILAGVMKVKAEREKVPQTEDATSVNIPEEATEKTDRDSASPPSKTPSLLPPIKQHILTVWRGLETLDFNLRAGVAFAGFTAIVFLLMANIWVQRPALWPAILAMLFSVIAAVLATIIAQYLADIDPAVLPESVGLCRGARVTAWIFVLVAISVALQWTNQDLIVRAIYYTILFLDASICYGLFRTRQRKDTDGETFRLDFALLSVLGSRPNILASALDAVERQLGIDLRTTWALIIVRRALEPLLIGLCLIAWLSTSLTVVGTDDQGLVERLGVPQAGQLEPGIHLHWPWPIDRIFQIPVKRVMDIQVGHQGEEKEGPENVLWAVEHAPNEYTLVLGNGRDLITIDADVQYQIVDPHAWRYRCQNPEDALRAIAYRAVMRSTVELTLSQAVSQNISVLATKMRTIVQKDADNFGLGVHILAFTVGGLHPPVPVALAYEDVVSAQLGAVTATINAQAFRNQTVPGAEATVYSGENTAREESAEAMALAAGQAWSFRALEAQYHAEPGEYLFRRRLETLEKDLSARPYLVVDDRFLRDGGEIWQRP